MDGRLLGHYLWSPDAATPSLQISRPTLSFDYTHRRQQAFAFTEAKAATSDPPVAVRITGIDAVALATYRATWEGLHPSGYGGFEWVQLWHRHCPQRVRSFHCALWHGSVLCGLALGTVPRSHRFLTIRCMEGQPGGHPLRGKVARIVPGTAEYYASSLAVPRVRIENPAPGLVMMYRDLGYSLALREGATRYPVLNLSTE